RHIAFAASPGRNMLRLIHWVSLSRRLPIPQVATAPSAPFEIKKARPINLAGAPERSVRVRAREVSALQVPAVRFLPETLCRRAQAIVLGRSRAGGLSPRRPALVRS